MNNPTILVVDDNPSDALLLRRLFRNAAITNPIQELSDGKDAIAYLSNEGLFSDRTKFPQPGLLFLDLRMPIPGTRVLEWLRQHPRPSPMLVVVTTDTNNLDDIRQAYALGANSFLMKPVSEEDILNLVRGLNRLNINSIGEGYQISVHADSSKQPMPRQVSSQ